MANPLIPFSERGGRIRIDDPRFEEWLVELILAPREGLSIYIEYQGYEIEWRPGQLDVYGWWSDRVIDAARRALYNIHGQGLQILYSHAMGFYYIIAWEMTHLFRLDFHEVDHVMWTGESYPDELIQIPCPIRFEEEDIRVHIQESTWTLYEDDENEYDGYRHLFEWIQRLLPKDGHLRIWVSDREDRETDIDAWLEISAKTRTILRLDKRPLISWTNQICTRYLVDGESSLDLYNQPTSFLLLEPLEELSEPPETVLETFQHQVDVSVMFTQNGQRAAPEFYSHMNRAWIYFSPEHLDFPLSDDLVRRITRFL
jgi:hypothetical protein